MSTRSPTKSELLEEIVGLKERIRELEFSARSPAEGLTGEPDYRIVADNTYDWEWWIGPDHQFIYCSPSCLRITGREAQEFLADPGLLFRIIHPDHRQAFSLHDHDVRRKGESRGLEFVIVRPDGQERWIGHVCQAVYRDDGTAMGIRGSNRDITDRKRAEEALRKSEEKFQRLVDRVPWPLCLANKESILVYFNARFTEVFGYTSRDIPTLDEWWRLAYPDEGYRQRVMETWNGLSEGPRRRGRTSSPSNTG